MLLHFILCLLTMLPFTMAAVGTGTSKAIMKNIAKAGSETKCGNVTVPYPFGIGKDTGCSLNEKFYLTCNTSSSIDKPPGLFISSGNLRLYNISDSELHIHTGVGFRCYNQDGGVNMKGFFFYLIYQISMYFIILSYFSHYKL